MTFFERFLALDRRVIYPLVGLAVVLPLVFPIGFKVRPTPPAENLFRAVDRLKPGTPVLVSIDYDPSTEAELSPMAIAIFRHCIRRHLPLVVIALDPGAPGLGVTLLDKVARETHARYGVDYCFLGYKSGAEAVILAFGRDLRLAYPADYYNIPVEQLPLLRHVKNYDDLGLVISLAAANYPDVWVAYAHERFGARFAAGVTAVMAPEYYPYLDTGQLVGMLGGLKGAAEYEALLGRPGLGLKGMDAQTIVHLFIVLIIVLGNVAYFITRRQAARTRP